MHWVQVLIGPVGVVLQACARLPSAVACPLAQGFALVPVTDRLVGELQTVVHRQSDEVLLHSGEMAPGLAKMAAELSMNGPMVYAATFIHGGTGGQDAVVWCDGDVVLNIGDDEDTMSAWPDSPISRALRRAGVVASDGMDEFDTIGLGRYRSNEAWEQAFHTPVNDFPG